MICIEIHLSDRVFIDQRIDSNLVLSRLKILEWRNQATRLKWRVLERPCNRGLASPLLWLDELINGADIHVILIGVLESKILVGGIGCVHADELTI